MRRARFYILILGLTLLPQVVAASDLVRWLAAQGQLALGLSVPGLLLALNLPMLAEVLRRRNAQLAPEILRFAALLPAVVVALFLSADFLGDATYLEPFAFVLALAGFAPALLRGSTGYAIAAGLGLFICVNEVWAKHDRGSQPTGAVLTVRTNVPGAGSP